MRDRGKNHSGVKVGKELNPTENLRKLYVRYLLLGVILMTLPWYLPALFFVPVQFLILLTAFVSIVFVSVLFWIDLYSRTVVYVLSNDEITWSRGVWFKGTGIVPYNRITNVDILQGPISRKLEVASLKIQTAGYSGSPSSMHSAEIRIDGLKNYMEVRDIIMGFVHGRKPVAVQTFSEKNEKDLVLGELVKIRKLLEKR